MGKTIEMSKLIYIVIDGLGDLPVEEFSGYTPLEFAKTPNLDYLAITGKLGLMYTVGKGIAPESDVAVISILGYDPYEYHAGRGPLEAFGAGLDMIDGNIAVRCNFATLDNKKRIVDRRAGRNLTTEEASILARAINREVTLDSHPAKFEFKNTLGHRGALVIKSSKGRLSGKVSNTDPAYERVNGLGVAKNKVEMKLKKCDPLDETKSAKISAELINEFTEKSHQVLDKHTVNKNRASKGKMKANVILTRDAGDELPKLFNLGSYYKKSFACLVDMPVEKGIAILAGMQPIYLPPPSKSVKNDSILRVKRLLKILTSFDCFYIHIKGPDEPGHDGNFKRKARIIEGIDKFFFGKLLENIDLKKTLICVTADHSTPCSLKAHSDDPVPLLISGSGIEPDGIEGFTEKKCQKGSIGVLTKGTELMPLLIKLL
jgi:2,3-bisphosphoglycerate-independent phosphoglycerate mutase